MNNSVYFCMYSRPRKENLEIFQSKMVLTVENKQIKSKSTAKLEEEIQTELTREKKAQRAKRRQSASGGNTLLEVAESPEKTQSSPERKRMEGNGFDGISDVNSLVDPDIFSKCCGFIRVNCLAILVESTRNPGRSEKDRNSRINGKSNEVTTSRINGVPITNRKSHVLRKGMGMYCFQSAINHSNSPNAYMLTYDGFRENRRSMEWNRENPDENCKVVARDLRLAQKQRRAESGMEFTKEDAELPKEGVKTNEPNLVKTKVGRRQIEQFPTAEQIISARPSFASCAIVASERIPKGAEIFIDYLEGADFPPEARRAILERQYGIVIPEDGEDQERETESADTAGGGNESGHRESRDRWVEYEDGRGGAGGMGQEICEEFENLSLNRSRKESHDSGGFSSPGFSSGDDFREAGG